MNRSSLLPDVLAVPSVLAMFSIAMLTTSAFAGFGTQTLKLLPADGAAEDAFGWSVGTAGGIIVVGSPEDDDNGPSSGSAYLFNATTGAQLTKIVPDDGESGDQFGFSVAIDGGIVVVGAVADDDNGVGSGSAYVFDAATGAQLAKLVPDDGASGDEFGFSVAIDGGIVIVGSKRDDDNGMDSGAAYLFNAATGAQLHKLVPDDGTANDNFGGSVAIDGGVAAAGAHAKWNGPLFLAGAAYLFDASTGDQLHKLLPDDAAVSDFFGSAIDIDDGIVLVGAWAKSIVFDHSGAAYLFEASSGDQIGPRLAPADTDDRDNFGYAVAIENGLVAASAPGDSDGGLFEAGSAYFYAAPGGEELMEARAEDRAPLDNFGTGIALADGFLVVGVEHDDDNGPNSGSAYVFDAGNGGCPEDLDESGVVDVGDLLSLLAAWGGTAGDINGDGTTDVADLLQLLAAWGPC
jgi:hypothetical protein